MINGFCSEVELGVSALLTNVLLLKQVSWRCRWGQEHILPPWHPPPAGPDLLSTAWWSSWTLLPHETGEHCPLETQYEWLTLQPPVIQSCFPINLNHMSQHGLTHCKPMLHKTDCKTHYERAQIYGGHSPAVSLLPVWRPEAAAKRHRGTAKDAWLFCLS